MTTNKNNMNANPNAKNARSDEDAAFIEEAKNMLYVLCAATGKRMMASFVIIRDDDERAIAETVFLGYDGVRREKCASDIVVATTVLLELICKKIKDTVKLTELFKDEAKERRLGLLSIRDKLIFGCQKAFEKTGIFELRVKQEGGDK